MGPPERNRQTETKVEQGAQEAKAGGPWWLWPRPSARLLQPGPLYPPQKNPWGSSGVSGALRGETHSKTWFKKTLVTVWSNTATAAGETITGWPWPLNGGGRRAGGSHSRRRPSDSGRQVGLPRELEGAADGGLAFPTDGGVISANGGVGEPQTVASTPANGGMLSRKQWRQLPWTAGWRSRERAAWTRMSSHEPRDGRAANGGVNSRERAGMRARGERTRLPRGTKHRNNQKTWKNEQNKTRWRDDAYCLVWSSVTVHTAGRNEEHADEDILLSNSL